MGLCHQKDVAGSRRSPGSLNAPAFTHRYRLLAQTPDLFAGGNMRIVSEREFPISTTMTGALLTIRPGAMRKRIGIPMPRSGNSM
jgi:oxalate decarboxylase/phosphoglucose isomerase-like protein (cupin superfamily)